MFVELRNLNEPVLRPRPLPTEADVAAVERRTGISFQADVRRYLLKASDVVFGVLEPVTIGGGHTDFEEVLRSARQWEVPTTDATVRGQQRRLLRCSFW